MFNSKRPDVNLLINGDGIPADWLIALLSLWNGRANDAADLHPNDECRTLESLAYYRCATDLIEALNTVYPKWYEKGAQTETSMSTDSNILDQMEDELSDLAGHWRSKPNTATVQKYHRVYRQMVQLGWDQRPDVEDHLPSELMPQEYHDLLSKRSHGQP